MIFKVAGRNGNMIADAMGAHFRPACLVLILVFICACGSVSSEVDSWEELLRRQHQELIDTSRAVDTLVSNLPNRLSHLQKHLYLLKSRFERLMLYFDLRSGNPLVLRDILGVVDWFEDEANRLVSPFKQEKASIERQLENLNDLSKKFRHEGHLIKHAGAEVRSKITSYSNDLAALETRLIPLNQQLILGIHAAQSFVRELKENQSQIEHESNRILKTHLLKRSHGFFSAQAWMEGMAAFKKWMATFNVYLLEPIDLERSGWTLFISKILFFSILILGLCVSYKKKIQKRFDTLKAVRLFPSFLSFSMSMGIFLGILSTGLFPSSFFSTMASVMLAYSFLSLSSKLHHFLFHEEDRTLCRLVPLWGPVSLCGLMVAIHLPEEAFIPVWSVWLMILCWYYTKTGLGMTGWERMTRWVLVMALPFLTVMALMGWGYLSVLLGSLLLVFFLDIRLAQVLSVALGRMASGRQQMSTAASPATPAKAKTLGFPLIFLSLLLASFAWVFIFVGGGVLFMEVIRYRVGWEKFTFSIYRIFCIFALLFMVRAGIALGRSALSGLPGRRPEMDSGSIQTLESILTYVMGSVFVLGTLGLLGLGLRNLAVVAGGLSVGLGFGLQNIVNNFIGGMILLFGRSIQPGDLLEVEDVKGHVRKVTIRNTVVRTFSGATIFIPNSLLISQKVTNWSHGDRRYRQEINVGVAYGSDVAKVTDLLLEAAKQSVKVLDRPPPRVRFLDFGDSTLVFSLRVWIKGWSDRYADSEVRYHIDRIFRENNIEISFPQLDLHVRSAEGLRHFRDETSKNKGDTDAVSGKSFDD